MLQFYSGELLPRRSYPTLSMSERFLSAVRVGRGLSSLSLFGDWDWAEAAEHERTKGEECQADRGRSVRLWPEVGEERYKK